eukprot:Skav202519  [mRNA]  locus=scaffold1359:335842:340289:- [translate_table: standard]
MPIPYPEVFSSGAAKACNGFYLKKLVSMQVMALSWISLGGPSVAPSILSLGTRLSAKQWSVVKYLEHLCTDGNTPLHVDASLMGRAASKIESVEKTLEALHRSIAFLKAEENHYNSHGLSRPEVVGDASLASRAGKPPIELATPLEDVDLGEVPTVRVFADNFNKVMLYRKMAESGRLEPVLLKHKRGPFVSGLFAVPKDLQRDRMVLDARPANFTGPHQNMWCKAMASPTVLANIMIADDMVLLASGEDLKDFFYQFTAGAQRTQRNILSDPISIDEARVVFGPDFEWPESPVWVGLSSLAMGDALACEVAQGSHVAICLKYGVSKVQELITLKDPLPRGLLQVGIIIDDLVILEQCLRSDLEQINDGSLATEADDRVKRANDGYNKEKLQTNPAKGFHNQHLARFWGVEIDGLKGILRGSSTRSWAVMLVTLRVASLGLATVGLLEALAGSWISLYGVRRRMLCILQNIFGALSIEGQQTVVRLSTDLVDELLLLATLSPLAAVDLRAPFAHRLIATDASLECMAAVDAPLSSTISQELCRTSLIKGRWTRLLTPSQCWEKSHDLLHGDDEIEEPYSTHILWELCARALHFDELWREPVQRKRHINVLEAKAMLREERRLSSKVSPLRQPFAMDSQVCLGSFVKGRSSSVSLNAAMLRNLPFPLGSGLFPHYIFFPSELNRADGPTRKSKPKAPDMVLPHWFNAPQPECLKGLDEWLSRNGVDQNSDLPFDKLGEGPRLDLSPKSKKSKPKRKGTQKIGSDPEVTSTMHDASSVPMEHDSKGQSSLADAVTCQSDRCYSMSVEVADPESRSELKGIHPEAGPPEIKHKECPSKDAHSSRIKSLIQKLFDRFPKEQFIFSKKPVDMFQPGGLDLYSGNRGVATHMVKHGAPWVLCFDWKHGPHQDLLDKQLQDELISLVQEGCFRSIGMAPICASFSRAITPAVRSRRWPRGFPSLRGPMLVKVIAGNKHASFCATLIEIALRLNLAFWLENPDKSFLWLQKRYQDFRHPASKSVFRLSFCRFGTRWRKDTRVATNTSLAARRMMCTCAGRPHQVLRGYSVLHRMSWTRVAEPYPRGFAKLLAMALCVKAGWLSSQRLDVAGCCRAPSLRIGEAQNPGPRRQLGARHSLQEVPLISPATLALEARLLQGFVDWCRSSFRTSTCDVVFDRCPEALGYLLKIFGDMMFQNRRGLSNFRHLLLAVQRWKPLSRPFMHQAWDFVNRWENQEPVEHRNPIPETLVRALVVMAWLHGWFAWAAATILAFYGGGRLGEILQCCREDLLLPVDFIEPGPAPVFLRLRYFKTRNRQPAKVQHLRITDITACQILHVLMRGVDPHVPMFGSSAYQYRKRWNLMMDCLQIPQNIRLTPGGLRGGFAVWAYRNGRPIQDIMWAMRLRSQVTLESYLQETAALNCFAGLPVNVRRSITSTASVFSILPLAAP